MNKAPVIGLAGLVGAGLFAIPLTSTADNPAPSNTTADSAYLKRDEQADELVLVGDDDADDTLDRTGLTNTRNSRGTQVSVNTRDTRGIQDPATISRNSRADMTDNGQTGDNTRSRVDQATNTAATNTRNTANTRDSANTVNTENSANTADSRDDVSNTDVSGDDSGDSRD